MRSQGSSWKLRATLPCSKAAPGRTPGRLVRAAWKQAGRTTAAALCWRNPACKGSTASVTTSQEGVIWRSRAAQAYWHAQHHVPRSAAGDCEVTLWSMADPRQGGMGRVHRELIRTMRRGAHLRAAGLVDRHPDDHAYGACALLLSRLRQGSLCTAHGPAVGGTESEAGPCSRRAQPAPRAAGSGTNAVTAP